MAACTLCKSILQDDILFGEFLSNRKMAVHTFCLYLSSNLVQRGRDTEGFLGFLFTDITKEARRICPLKCCYCGKKCANIGCCERKCRRSFHLACGLKYGAQFEFIKAYRSYCDRHVPTKDNIPRSKEKCCICYEEMRAQAKKCIHVNMICSPCCRSGWFHKRCLQMLANTAGYFFKCPLCNDTKTFRHKVRYRGIFIPDRDAAWELEPNAFTELLERPDACSAKVCYSRTRKSHSDSNPLTYCVTCGSVGIHRKCLSSGCSSFNCCDCKQILGIDNGSESQETRSDEEAHEDDSDIDVDVCNDNAETAEHYIYERTEKHRKSDEKEDYDEDNIKPVTYGSSRKLLDTDEEVDDTISTRRVYSTTYHITDNSTEHEISTTNPVEDGRQEANNNDSIMEDPLDDSENYCLELDKKTLNKIKLRGRTMRILSYSDEDSSTNEKLCRNGINTTAASTCRDSIYSPKKHADAAPKCTSEKSTMSSKREEKKTLNKTKLRGRTMRILSYSDEDSSTNEKLCRNGINTTAASTCRDSIFSPKKHADAAPKCTSEKSSMSSKREVRTEMLYTGSSSQMLAEKGTKKSGTEKLCCSSTAKEATVPIENPDSNKCARRKSIFIERSSKTHDFENNPDRDYADTNSVSPNETSTKTSSQLETQSSSDEEYSEFPSNANAFRSRAHALLKRATPRSSSPLILSAKRARHCRLQINNCNGESVNENKTDSQRVRMNGIASSRYQSSYSKNVNPYIEPRFVRSKDGKLRKVVPPCKSPPHNNNFHKSYKFLVG